MNTYKIQLKLHTLARCVVSHKKGTWDSFKFDTLHFSHWYFTFSQGHRKDAWLISGEVKAKNIRDAEKKFVKKLNNIIPKIALISQCYTEYLGESFLIHKFGSDIAYFRYVRASKGVGLHFDNDSLEALKILCSLSAHISKEFFYYWNDMVNTVGYSAKLLLMCAALEALAKSKLNLTYKCIKRQPNPNENQKIKKFIATEILGKRLYNKLYASNDRGVRHRLTHGSYFSFTKDGEENYIEQVYEKMLRYFNKNIFKKNLISEKVVNPQRTPYGNKVENRVWLRSLSTSSKFDLKKLMAECDAKGIDQCKGVEIISSAEVGANY